MHRFTIYIFSIHIHMFYSIYVLSFIMGSFNSTVVI